MSTPVVESDDFGFEFENLLHGHIGALYEGATLAKLETVPVDYCLVHVDSGELLLLVRPGHELSPSQRGHVIELSRAAVEGSHPGWQRNDEGGFWYTASAEVRIDNPWA